MRVAVQHDKYNVVSWSLSHPKQQKQNIIIKAKNHKGSGVAENKV